MKDINSLKGVIGELNQSPIFNLSLSSMELFHSNFLYWFGVRYPHHLGSIFYDYLNEKPNETNEIIIDREKRNIDLYLKYSNEQEVLIENKVKSIPNRSQLISYSKKNPNKNYVLLSLSKPTFLNGVNKYIIEDGKEVWHYLSYSSLKEKLETIAPQIEDPYDKFILEDYIEFLNGLTKINEVCEVEQTDYFNFNTTENYRLLQNIRMHDLYLKSKYEKLAYLLYEELTERKESKDKLLDFGMPFKDVTAEKPIFIGSGMTRSQGLLDFKYRITKNLALGIQIQGDSYRLVVEGEKAEKIKDKIDNEKLWFDFSSSFPDKKVYLKGRTYDNFCQFGNTFFYRSIKLGEEYTVKEVLNFIINDIDVIEQNIEEVKKLV